MMSAINLKKVAATFAISGAMGLTAVGGLGVAHADDGNGPWVPWIPWHPGQNIDDWADWHPGEGVPHWVPRPWPWHEGDWQDWQGDQ
jgi:hypothetical protein